MNNKWKYGDSWEHFPISEGEIWTEKKTESKVCVCDLFDRLPSFMEEADLIYTDSPWNTGNMKGFYTKAQKKTERTFAEFAAVLFDHIATIGAPVCYLEIGKQNLTNFLEEMEVLFPVVQHWQVTYYKRHKSYLVRGGQEKTDVNFTGIDDMITPRVAMENEQFTCVADLCMGRGLIATTAFELGKRFVGTELNKRRLAVTIEKVAKMGGEWLTTQR